jgi:hypothetical protein
MIAHSLRQARRERWSRQTAQPTTPALGMSPYNKRRMRGVFQALLHVIVAQSPLPPPVGHAMSLHPKGTP